MRAFIFFALLLSLASHSADNMPASPLHRLEAIETVINNSDDTSAVGGKKLTSAYFSLFPDAYRQSALASGDPSRIQEVFNAANLVEYYTGTPWFADQMRVSFDTILALGADRAGDYVRMYQAYISSEQFDKAQAFLDRFPNAAFQRLPAVSGETSRGAGMQTWEIDRTRNTMHQKDFALPGGAYIIVMSSPFCHFAQNAARDIARDPGLRKLMHERSLWLSRIDRIFSPPALHDWDARNPDFPMAVAANLSGWQQIDTWETPTFYFFYDGRLIKETKGWPEGGRMDEIAEFFARYPIHADGG